MYTGQPDDAASYNAALGVYNYTVPDYWTFDAFATYRINPALQVRLNVTNLTDAKSRIEDADFSAETTALAKQQILSQASTAMLAQANQSQQGVMKLIG